MSKLLFAAEDINTQVNKMAREVLRDHNNPKPVFVALLRGAAPFAVKLMLEITRQAPDFHPELDYMMVSTYGAAHRAGRPQIVTDLAPTTDIGGRTVIILDDVLDKGITADFVTQHLLRQGAMDVKLAVLVDKQTDRIKPVIADYTCFESPDVWLVGMGMDDGSAPEAYRWREDILALN